MRELVLRSSSPDHTRAIGAAIASSLLPGDVVMLSGDLGAGKTCLVQGAAVGLGARARVQSPSFVLVREYEATPRIVHADVYRLNSLGELFDLGIEELFAADAVTFVEWGDAVAGALPADRLEVEILAVDDAADARNITLRAPHASWQARLDDIAARAQEFAA